MTEKMNNARDLYFNSGKTQREIAEIVGVSERTIYNWVKTLNWQQIRGASYHMPVMIAENISSQIVALQESIQLREPSNRFPTAQEAEIQRKLINSLEKLQKYPTLGMYRQMFSNYCDSVRHRSEDFNWELRFSMDQFFEGEMRHGFMPFESAFHATHPNAPEREEPKKRKNRDADDYGDDELDDELDDDQDDDQDDELDEDEDEESNEEKPEVVLPAVVKRPSPKPAPGKEKKPEAKPENPPSYLEQLIEHQRNNPFSTSFPPPAETGKSTGSNTPSNPQNHKPGKLIKRY